eukprot:6205823-Pleurochrysis_carterae.AAC.4
MNTLNGNKLGRRAQLSEPAWEATVWRRIEKTFRQRRRMYFKERETLGKRSHRGCLMTLMICEAEAEAAKSA